MSAVRVARAFTGRKYIVKFEGCYHGHADGFLVKAGSGVATFGIAGSAGVPEEIAHWTLALPYNDLPALEEAFALHPGEIAAVIVEPVVGNIGCVVPAEGYLQGLRYVTEREGALLIFDEIQCGLGRTGEWFAFTRSGVQPDVLILGKPLCLLTCRHGRAASHAASICWRCTSGSWDDAVWCPPGSARALHGRPTRLWSAPRQVAAAAPLLGLASGPWMQSALTARLAAVTAQAAVPVSLLEACTWFPEVTYPWRWAELSCQSCGADQPLPIVKPHALCLLPLCACALHAAVCPAVGLTLCCVRAGYGPPPGYGMPGYGPPAGFPGYGPPAGFPGYGPPAGLMLSGNPGMTDV